MSIIVDSISNITSTPIIGNPNSNLNYILNNSSITSIWDLNNKVAAFNILMFRDAFKYKSEKDMPDDIYIKYCKFRNRVENLIGE